VIGLDPYVRLAGGEIRAFPDGPIKALRQSEKREDALERASQVAAKRPIGVEGGDVVRREQRGVWIELAWLRQREEPLDKVVDAFQRVVSPGPQVAQPAAFAVGGLATIEVEQTGHGGFLFGKVGHRGGAKKQLSLRIRYDIRVGLISPS